jgi:hypothetical protein
MRDNKMKMIRMTAQLNHLIDELEMEIEDQKNIDESEYLNEDGIDEDCQHLSLDELMNLIKNKLN